MPKTKEQKKVIITEDSIAIPNDLGVAPYDTILVLQAQGNNRTDSGLFLPESAVERPPMGIVIVVGERTDGKPAQFTPGDHVIWGEEAGRELNVKGTEYLLIKHRDILWTYKN
jgi:chaperonin GroES